MIPHDLEFKLEDCDVSLPGNVRLMSVEKANALLAERLGEIKRLGHKCRANYRCEHEMWSTPKKEHTHTAYLVGVRELNNE